MRYVVTVLRFALAIIFLYAAYTKLRQPWLLFLNADTVLDHGWEREASHFMEKVDKEPSRQAAAAFRLAIDDEGAAPRFIEALARLEARADQLAIAFEVELGAGELRLVAALGGGGVVEGGLEGLRVDLE